MRVGLNDKWDNQKLENKWVISSYEIYNSESGIPFRPISQLQEVGLEPSKLTEPNLTTNPLKTQDLSPLEQAQAEKLAKLESESGNKIFDFYSDRNWTDFRDANLHSGNHPYEPNLTQNPLTSQENLLKTRENLKKITQDNDTILRTFITDTPERYVRNHVRDADIIHSFIQPNRTAKSDNALSDVVVYGENITKKPLTSQEDLLKTRENLFITEILRVGLKDN